MKSSSTSLPHKPLEINSNSQPETSFAYFASFAPQEGWPQPLDEAAAHGLAGGFVRVVSPHSEADPVALLIQFLLAFGNVAGRKAHFRVEGDLHYMNGFGILVGETAKARKGVSWGRVEAMLKAVDPPWSAARIQSGLSSGEGLIWEVRDDDDSEDKRLLVYESEFASVLKVLRREGNILSAIIRQAWDTGNLNTLVKNNPAKATNAHISIIGHITREELLRHLDATEYANGFGNRFLWVCVRRANILPEGGSLDESELEPITRRLQEAVNFASETGEMARDEEARELWCEIYPELSEGHPGLYGAIIGRAEAQVLRLSCLYALLDCSATVTKAHLEAALAFVEVLRRLLPLHLRRLLGRPAC